MKHNVAWWLSRVAIVALALWLVLSIVDLVKVRAQVRIARDRILNADYGQLLTAGREMIEQQKKYGNLKSAKTVPAIIREMHPLDGGWCDTNCVYVRLHRAPRVGFMVFSEGLDDGWIRQRWPYVRMLTNGLAYCP